MGAFDCIKSGCSKEEKSQVPTFIFKIYTPKKWPYSKGKIM